MAVIVTGKDIPKSCQNCWNASCYFYGKEWTTIAQNKSYKTHRACPCPLVSSDEMVFELEHLPFRPYEGKETLNRKDVMDIVRKYMENSNG